KLKLSEHTTTTDPLRTFDGSTENALAYRKGASVAGGREEFDRLIGDTLRSLQPPPAVDNAGAVPPEPVDLRGEGTGLDGELRVTAVAGGRLESIQIDPRAMRTDSRTLAEQLVVAVNAALAAVQAKVQEAVAGAAPDRAALVHRLREVQDTAIPRMQSFLRAVEDLRRQATGEAGGADASRAAPARRAPPRR